MSTLDVKTFKEKYDISEVIRLLSERGYYYINDIDSSTITHIQNENVDIRTVDIYSDKFYNPLFKEEAKILSNITDLGRAIYTYVAPNSVVPQHCDEDSPEYIRLTSGVLPKKNNNIVFTVKDKDINLIYDTTIGFEASIEDHKGYNDTKKPWIVLILLIKRNDINEIINYV